MKIHLTKCGLACLFLIAALTGLAQNKDGDAKPGPGRFFVSTAGNDAWTGRFAEPNAGKTDGPFATLPRALEAVRGEKDERTVFVRNGTYYLRAPVLLTSVDSGTHIQAYPGERPVLSGGRPITGWRKGDGNIWSALIPEMRTNRWNFRQLRVGDELQTLARFPNLDSKEPLKGGWSSVIYTGPKAGAFGAAITKTHAVGDWLEWKITVPASANAPRPVPGALPVPETPEDYALWALYTGHTNMTGRTSLRVDGGAPVLLDNLAYTGTAFRWVRAATVKLTKGEHFARWTNDKGGAISLDAFLLSDDLNWNPAASPRPAAGKSMIVVQAEAFTASLAKEMGVPETATPAYKNRFQFRPGDIKSYPRSLEPEVHIFPGTGAASSILFLKNIDVNNRVAYVEENSNASEEIRAGNRYYISNVFEELDSPGEWYLSRTNTTLYYWPKSPEFQTRGVVAPALDRIFDLRGDPAKNQWVDRVTIEGFEFSDTTYSRTIVNATPTDAAIWLSGARSCVILGNRFINIGGYAARLENKSSQNEFTGNEVAYAGQGGVLLFGNTAAQPLDNSIVGNWMHHGGQIYKQVAGVLCLTASRTRVAHNRIEHMPRFAVSLRSLDDKTYSHENVVEYNDLLFTNEETSESGAVEILGRHKKETGDVIQFNRILDVVGLKTVPDGKLPLAGSTFGILLDDYASGVTIKGNLVARHDLGGVCINGGRGNVIVNNIFVQGTTDQLRYQVKDEFSVGNRFVKNIVVFKDPKAGLFKHTGRWRPQVLAETDNNLIWHVQGIPFFREAELTPLGTWEKWQAAGMDRNSIIADPLFKAAAKDDYQLPLNSPALKLGFQAIPFEKIGLAGFPRAWKL